MRILYIATLNSEHAKRWIRFFVQRKHDVHAVNIGAPENSHIDNITLHFEQFDHEKHPFVQDVFRRFIPFRNRINEIIRTVKPDIIHVHGVNIYAYMVHLCGYHPIIATAWGSEILIDPHESWKYKVTMKRVLKTSDAITCDAEHIKEEMIRFGAPREKVHIIYFGTDVE